MSLFRSLFGSQAPEISDPELLKNAVFEAVGRGDRKLLLGLCRKNSKAILDCFSTWQSVPEELRADQAGMQRYVHALVSVAQVFAEQLGRPELMNQLVGSRDSNPLLRWQDQLEQASQWMVEMRYRDARDLLVSLLIDVRSLEGSGADKYRPITLGYLGECYFQDREAEKALPHFQQALHLCEKSGDREGVVAYLGNLYEAHRYLGQSDAAAEYSERLACVLAQHGRTEEARRYRRQAQIVRAGEPLNRVVASVNGVHYELNEIDVVEDRRIQLAFERNRITLRQATELTRRGGELGSQGKHEEALALFREAAGADPFDPISRYQEAYALLHLERYAQAIESYQATEDLAPGWFQCRTNTWIAKQLELDHLGFDTGVAVLVLADSQLSPKETVGLAEQILSRAPDLAPAHLLRGKNLRLLNRVAEAKAAFLQGLACVDEPDVQTRLLVELGVISNDQQERVSYLRQAQELNGNLIAAAQASLVLKAAPALA